jgi:hypothetical protein
MTRRVMLFALSAALFLAGSPITALQAQMAPGAASPPGIDARIVAVGIPGASALAQIGPFLNDPKACANPIPSKFPSYIHLSCFCGSPFPLRSNDLSASDRRLSPPRYARVFRLG